MDERIKIYAEKMDKSYRSMMEEFGTIRAAGGKYQRSGAPYPADTALGGLHGEGH